MKDLVAYIASSLADDPSQVEVTQFQHGVQVDVYLRVAREDMGRVIGKSGRVANAIRLLLRVAGVQEGKRANLEIVEPDD